MTPAVFAQAAGVSDQLAARWAPHVTAAAELFKITTAPNLAMFIAQMGHESGGYKNTVESLNYRVEALLSQFGRHRISEIDARAYGRIDGKRAADQRAIANCIYGGEWGRKNLGNTQPGDGWDFRGRGLKQLTGRDNYRQSRNNLRIRLGTRVPDFEVVPDAVAEEEWAAMTGGEFWHRKGLNDVHTVEAATLVINGGTNGLDDRKARFDRALKVLTT